MTETKEPFAGYAILELMGHRRLAGYVRETELAGAGVLRLDVPEHPWVEGCTCGSSEPTSADYERHTHVCAMFRAEGDDEPLDVVATQFYAPSALYCLTPTTEEVARGLASKTRPQPVHRWELPAAPVQEAFVPPWEEGEPDVLDGPDEHSEAEWDDLQRDDDRPDPPMAEASE